MSSAENPLSVPGRNPPEWAVQEPGEGVHASTFAAGLVAVFAMSLLLPVAPWSVALLSAWGVMAGLRRTVRPGWRRIPMVGWWLPFSQFDAMLWVMTMGSSLTFALFLLGVGR